MEPSTNPSDPASGRPVIGLPRGAETIVPYKLKAPPIQPLSRSTDRQVPLVRLALYRD
jgi:hypothetical protein